MNKITHLFLLCALVVMSAFTAKAQTAVDYQTSTAPSNGAFANDTHWYTIYLRGTYLSVENVDDNAYFLSGNGFSTINNNIDKGLWCVVGDDTNGYKLYNKSAGTDKVLGINYVSGSTGGAARAKMVDASTENATTAGANNWLTTFNIHKNTQKNVGAFSLSVKGLTNYYLNQRTPYLAFWISGSAQEEIGSSFYFYDETSYDASVLTTALTNAQTLKTTYADKTGGLFQPTADEYNAYSEAIPTEAATTFSWDALRTLTTLASNFKAQIDAHTPTVGKYYAIKNAYTNKYITPNVIPAGAIDVVSGDKTKAAVWLLESGNSDGWYKLKNMYTNLYMNNLTVNTTASDYVIRTAGTYNGTCAISTSSNTSANTWFHANTGNSSVILWGASAGASRWLLEEVSLDDYNTYAPLPASQITALVNKATNFLGIDLTAEKATLQSDPTYENYLTYYNKFKAGTDNQYVRLQCAKSGNTRYLGLNDAYSSAQALNASTKQSNISTIWKLVPIEGQEGYKLMNANTGTYIYNIPNADGGSSSDVTPLTDYANGYKFTFTLKNQTNGNWNVIDGNNNKLNAETDGRINYWTDNANAGWYIFKATDIEVALHELGDASYASVYLPFSISAVSNANAYVANQAAENNTLVMQTTNDGGFAANQGVVLVSDTKASTATLTLGENTNTSLLGGTNTPVTLTDDNRSNYLVFGPKDGATNTVGFWTPASTLTTIAANRAFYQNASGQAVTLQFNGSVIEGINNITSANNTSAPIYDLTGRRVNNTLKGGIYIQNGKKFIVK